MYESFYGLARKPFDPTPDPRFLYLSEAHREALAQLIYGVTQSRGFMALTGEVGTGKTTLLQALVEEVDGVADVAYVFDSTLPFDEFLEYALADLGVPTPGESRARRIGALNRFLVEQQRAGRKTVLIIDEAQNLDARVLEQIRLLSNFESPTEKLLQIVLAGQPELAVKLARPDLRQLRQRIALRCLIGPLDERDTREYVRFRLRTAGAGHPLFTEGAVRAIGKYARGIPRVINVLCDHCLVLGYGRNRRTIDPTLVRLAIDHLEHGFRSARRAGRVRWRWRISAAATGLRTAAANVAGWAVR